MPRNHSHVRPQFYRYYSAYNRRTDEPIFIHGTAATCAHAMGIKVNTFYQYVTRMHRDAYIGKYDIVEEGREVDENG